jgi:PhoH-like ATPase
LAYKKGQSMATAKRRSSEGKKKFFILDTNVLVYDPSAIFEFADAEIGLPSIVLEELDNFKREGTDRGRSARQAIRLLDQLRSKGSLQQGVKLDNGSILRVLFLPLESLPKFPFKLEAEDNQILLEALALKNEGYEVIFVSKDLNARIKADALGIATHDYQREKVDINEFYRGWVKVAVPAVTLKDNDPAILKELEHDAPLSLNEYVILESQHNPFNFRIFRYLGNSRFAGVREPMIKWPFHARNPQQLIAMDLLFNDNINLVTLFGPAGTGKTFLALLAGLHKVIIEDLYEKMLVARPVIPLGRDIGYLPGNLQEKLYSWMLPVYDNMEFITHAAASMPQAQALEEEYKGKKNHNHNGHHGKKERKRRGGGIGSIDDLVHNGKLSLEAITYMRGRSIPFQYIIIDEVQNLTPHEVKTLITRVGEGSKIVLAGDPYQIDTPYLDFASNGLVVASQRFKGQGLFGSVYLETSERSELSKLASELL